MSFDNTRAIAVKMLTKDELIEVHKKEERQGYYLLPYEVASFSKRAYSVGCNINKYWSIPDNQHAQSAHSEFVGAQVRRLMSEKKCHFFNDDLEALANFDFHVLNSDLDFVYHAGKRSAVSSVEKESDIFGDEEQSVIDFKARSSGDL